MSEQLNELLDDLKKWIDSPLDDINKNYGIWELDFNQSKELLNYIKQLQQENQQLKEQLQQRDEVIDEVINIIEDNRDYQDVHKQIGIDEFEDVREDILFEKDINELL